MNSLIRSVCVRFVIATLLTLSAFSQTNCADRPLRNFTYVDGDTPWTHHIPTEINGTWEQVLELDRKLLNPQSCSGERPEIQLLPQVSIRWICLEGGGLKMVLPQGYPDWSTLVVTSPAKGGLYEQKHMTTGKIPEFYNTESKFQTSYFLYPFEDYEIPTFFPEETKLYLQLWKRNFMSRNKMGDDYFKEHIRVIGVTIEHSNFGGNSNRRFTVNYYYSVDWARIELNDRLWLPSPTMGPEFDSTAVMSYDSLAAWERWIQEDTAIGLSHMFNVIVPITKLASKADVIIATANASTLLGFDVNHGIKLDRSGQLVMHLYGVIDFDANKCLRATILLGNATVSEVQRTWCWIN